VAPKTPRRADQWVILDAGRQIRTGAPAHDRRKAEKALERYLGRKHKPDFGDGHPARVAVADALAVYSEKHAPTTKRPDLIGSAALKLAEFFGSKNCAAINASTCIDYVAWRSAQKDARGKIDSGKRVSPSTARRELVVLSAALRWCWREGKLDRPIPVTLPAQSEPRERHLTRAEAAQLLWGALGFDDSGKRHPFRINRHLARFILIGIYTGTRHDAILRLQWLPNTTGGWVDIKGGVLYRRPTGAVERGKRRTPLPIPPRLLPHLRRWRNTSRFLIEWQGLPIASQERRAWRRARELAGLGPDVTPHVLRHTAATWLLQRGVSVYDVAGVLGCSEEVIRRTYGHHAKDHLRTAVAAFSRRQ
jgi:integrase